MPDRVLAPALDADIAAALRRLRVEARRATPVTGLPSRTSDRATFRIELADGRTVKARRLTGAAKARRYAKLVRSLDHLPLPAVLAIAGRVTVEEWVEGRVLGDLRLTRTRLHQAADILGALHTMRRSGRRRRAESVSTRALVASTRRKMAELEAAGALSRREAISLRAAIRRLAPAAAAAGLTHEDFCAENIVEDAQRRLHVVDNGGLRRGFLDFDLARTWYRWPMSGAAWQTFVRQYRTWRAPQPPAEPVPFWRLAAVLKSARYRLTRRSRGIEIPLRRLRDLLRES